MNLKISEVGTMVLDMFSNDQLCSFFMMLSGPGLLFGSDDIGFIQ